jgi:hypothetical protein
MTKHQAPNHKQAPMFKILMTERTGFSHLSLVLGNCLVLLVGCNTPEHPDVGRVSGVITLNGQPLAEATVMFQPTQGRASIATTDSAGKYSLTYLDGVPGALLGTHKVIIRTEIPGEDGQPPIAKEKLPKKYHELTELTAEVKKGSNTFNFELKGPTASAKK